MRTRPELPAAPLCARGIEEGQLVLPGRAVIHLKRDNHSDRLSIQQGRSTLPSLHSLDCQFTESEGSAFYDPNGSHGTIGSDNAFREDGSRIIGTYCGFGHGRTGHVLAGGGAGTYRGSGIRLLSVDGAWKWRESRWSGET